MANWAHFPHGSDIGIRGEGQTLSESFAMAANALTALLADPAKISPQETVTEEMTSDSLDLLFYDWINQLIYETATKKLIFNDFQITVTQNPPRLTGVLRGEKVDHLKHDLGTEVKGATFTELKVQQNNGTWICQCVVDL